MAGDDTRASRAEPAPGVGREEALAADVRAELVALLYRNTPFAVLANVVNAALASTVIWRTAPAAVFGTWLGSLLLVSTVRWVLFRRHGAVARPDAVAWERRIIAVTFVTGTCWGIAGILLFRYGDTMEMGFAAFLLGGIAAAAVAMLGAIRAAYLGFSLPITTSLAAMLLWRGDPVSLAMAGLCVVFQVAMVGTLQRVYSLFRHDIELRLVNERLVRQLTATADDLKRTNAELGHEICERVRAEAHIAFLASHDPLTGLPNRLMQEDRFAQAVARASQARGKVGLLFIDLDRFKTINDSFGHPAGDTLLREVAARLKGCLRTGDSVCRQGGDEFLLLLGEVADRDAVASIAERVLMALSEPVEVEGETFAVGGSIGASLYPDDGQEFDLLVRRADMALYRAKRLGRGRFCSYEADLEEIA